MDSCKRGLTNQELMLLKLGSGGGGGGGEDKPYMSLDRLNRYLYKVSFREMPVGNGDGGGTFGGACSSYVKDGKLYRNLDWNYDETASFIVSLPGIDGMAFINGLTSDNLDDDLIAKLPWRIVDGVNDHGIMVSTHVLYNDWDAHGSGSIPLTSLPLKVLQTVTSMETIEDDLADILTDLRTTPAMDAAEYLIQVLVTDGETTYVLRPGNSADGTYEAVDATSNPKLTNFRWVSDAEVEREDLQDRPTGVERWNMMPCELSELRFTKAYEEPTRLSEFIGIDGTDKDSTDSELEDIYDTAHEMYLIRERDGTLWQTMHSVVYSPERMEHLWIQENWGWDYARCGCDLPRFGLYFDGQLMLLPEDWITVDGDKLLIDESHMEVTADGKLLIDGGRLVPLIVTENGTYTPIDGEGFAPVIVSVTAQN